MKMLKVKWKNSGVELYAVDNNTKGRIAKYIEQIEEHEIVDITEKLVFVREDDTISTMPYVEDMDIDNIKTRLIELDNNAISKVSPIKSHKIVKINDMPKNRLFRNQQILKNGKVIVDMDKAREFHLNRIRKARNAELKKLDIDYLIADEQKNNQKKIELYNYKQKLREITNPNSKLHNFDLNVAKTAEELDSLWPEELINYKC